MNTKKHKNKTLIQIISIIVITFTATLYSFPIDQNSQQLAINIYRLLGEGAS
jgi:hypothetical protein